jgi:hypothetical protein
MAENVPRNDDIAAYRDIDAMQWEIPWDAQEFVRKRVSSVGHDAMKTVINMFNTYSPKWEILPRGPADADTAERLERWLEWQMEQTNTKGAQEPFRKMLKSSAMSAVVAAQLDYLPYWLENSEERKELLRNGAFCINVHEADTVHYEIGKYGLRWAAQVSVMGVADILDIWEQYEEGNDDLKAALNSVREYVEGSEEEATFVYVDYTDKDHRWVFCIEGDTADAESLELGDDANAITILDVENELPFINWVITEATGEPLFKSIHESGSWENDNFLMTLSDSTIIRRAYFPLLIHTSASGQDIEEDFTGAEVKLKVPAGDTVGQLNPPPLDPGIREMMDRNSGAMRSGLGVAGLQNTDVTGNVQFATVNAQIQLSKTVLDPHLRAFERACVNLGKLAFMWVKYQGDTVTSYRTRTKGNKVRGEKINVSPKDYDPDSLIIRCEILDNAPTDDMQRWNIFSGMKQMGLHIPDSEFIERTGMGDPETLEARWLDEQALNLAWQVFSQKKMAEMQMQVQQQAQAAQQEAMAAAAGQAQGQSPPQQGQTQPAFDGTQGQGFDPSRGGSSPAEALPSLTQTATRQ